MAGTTGLEPATRDLCRDSEKDGRNLQKTSVTDGFFWRFKKRSGTVIEPISNPRPLPCRPLPLVCQLAYRCSFLFDFDQLTRAMMSRMGGWPKKAAVLPADPQGRTLRHRICAGGDVLCRKIQSDFEALPYFASGGPPVSCKRSSSIVAAP